MTRDVGFRIMVVVKVLRLVTIRHLTEVCVKKIVKVKFYILTFRLKSICFTSLNAQIIYIYYFEFAQLYYVFSTGLFDYISLFC